MVGERRATPGVGVVALAALAGEVVRGPIGCVACRAIRLPRVIERGGLPGRGSMTGAALAGIVLGRRSHLMALLALGEIGMIECGGLKREAV